jgi:hypothetical protein
MEFEAGFFRWVLRCFTLPTVFPDLDNQKDERLVIPWSARWFLPKSPGSPFRLRRP